MGGLVSEAELRLYLKKQSGHAGSIKKVFDLTDFVVAYANIFYPSDSMSVTDKAKATAAAGSALHMEGEWKNMAAFALSFGTKLLRKLERAFDFYAKKDTQGVARMPAASIIDAFHTVGKAVTVTRLQEWMTDADVQPMDLLTLADFAAVFAFFFTPPAAVGSAGHGTPAGDEDADRYGSMSMSEIAIQTLQDERWRATDEQTISFIRRLSSGRTEQMMTTIGAVRDAFESSAGFRDGEASLTDLEEIFRKAKVPPQSTQLAINKFTDRLKKTGRGTFSLPEMFEFFGSIIQEAGDSSVSVAEAFAMLRLHYNAADVRGVADMALKVTSNILDHTNDSKFWLVNIRSEEFYAKVWQKSEGKALMKAIGFGEPYDHVTPDGKSRKVIGLNVLPQNLGSISKLPASAIGLLKGKRLEIEQEIVALEGAPSVSAAIREIRAYHTLSESRTGVETALTFVRNVLNQPKDMRLYRVKKSNPAFHRALGCLRNSHLLMHAIGFLGGDDDGDVASNTYILKSVNTSGKATKADATFDPSIAGVPDKTKSFKFPALDPETERFLWRRKADLETALRAMDKMEDDAPTGGSAANDAAHVLGTTSKALEERSKQVRKSLEDAGGNSVGTQKKGDKGSDRSKDPFAGGAHKGEGLNLKDFLRGATAAQQTQVKMIQDVFKQMDADSDGLLSVSDVRAYFRSIGRNASDLMTRRWIRARDMDQDGAVSLPEFVASFAPQLDPKSKYINDHGKPEEPAVSATPITAAFGAVKLGCSTAEAIECCKAITEYVRRVIDSPSIKSFWSIVISDAIFQRRVGRCFGGIKLMNALGFMPEGNGSVLALRDPNGKVWEVVPKDVLVQMNTGLEELASHEAALLEPTISNIAAVSSAMEAMGDTREKAESWLMAMETISAILGNVIAYPRNGKYYHINASNPNFYRRVASVNGALQVLVSLGFREEEGGGLQLPIDTDISVLSARQLELQCGLNLV